MRKIFTLIAMALMTMGASAQTLTFAEALDAGNANTLTLGDENFNVVLNGGSKAKVVEKSLTFAVDETSAPEQFTLQWAPGGGIAKTDATKERCVAITVSKAGKLTVYPRSAGNDDRAFTIQQNGNTILEGTAYNAQQVTIDEKSYYKAYTVDIAAGTAYLLATDAVNLSAFKFEAGEGGGEEQGGGEQGGEETGNTASVASYDAGTKVGTWSIVGTKADAGSLEYSAKYDTNKTAVTCITFPNSATSEGAWQYAVKIEGEFKAGDVITIQPFTSMSNSDFTGGSKYANILLYCEKDEAPKQIADLTGSAAGALTVTDGHEEAGAPKEFNYTLEEDYTNLFFARGGNTRINLMKVVIERKGATGIQKIVELKANNGVMYNLAGQKVGSDYKGIVILNGKKVIVK